jgi:hypothetical protein
MFGGLELGREFFDGLTAIDKAILADAAKEQCVSCGGPLHRADYPRKPRFGRIAAASVDFDRRFSLCCGRGGCRRRATPPSVRFLGRRVYAAAVVVVASVVALAQRAVSATRRATGVAARTTRRWLGWWRVPFTKTRAFVDIAARLPGPVRLRLPTWVLERLPGEPTSRLEALLKWLLPITTREGRLPRLARDPT